MRKVYLVIVFFSLSAYAQNKEQKQIDSLLIRLKNVNIDSSKVNIFNKLAINYQYIDQLVGEKYVLKALQLSRKIEFIKGESDALLSLINYQIDKGENEKALVNCKIVKNIFKAQNDICNLTNIEIVEGNIFTSLRRNGEAINSFFTAQKLYESCKSPSMKAKVIRTNVGLGNLYNDINNHKKAIFYYNKAIALYKKEPDKQFEIAMTTGNKGLVYHAMKKYELALKNYAYAEGIVLKTSNMIGIAYIKSWYSITYMSMKKFELSIQKANESLKYIDKLNIEFLKANQIQNIGFCYLSLYKEKPKKEYLYKAKKYIIESIELNKKINDLSGISQSLDNLSDFYVIDHDFENALLIFKESRKYKDSIYNSDTKETIKNIEDKQTITLKSKQIEINKLDIATKEKQKWFYISGIGLLIIIGGLLFYQSRNRKKTNQKLQLLNTELDQANKIKTRFFSILNHDLRSPVANLIHFLHLQKENPELLDEATKTRMQNKTIAGAENLLASMEDILLWSKGQMVNFKPEPKKIALNQLFDDTKKVFSGYQQIKIDYKNPQDISLFTDENYLKTIVRNLTSNAINAFTTTTKPHIIWKAWQENNINYLSITDNGPGANQEQFKALYDDTQVVGIKTGLGLHLIRDLAKAINCEIKVSSTINQGTTITITL